MELFKLQVEESNLHPNFRAIYKNPVYRAQRSVLDNWASTFIDRDGKFVKEFQTSFNSSFWELYLFKLFNEFGFSVDLNYSRPDFLLNKDNLDYPGAPVTVVVKFHPLG